MYTDNRHGSSANERQPDNGGSRYSCNRKQERANVNANTNRQTQMGKRDHEQANTNANGQM